jgi:hypothetical protein
VFLPIFKGDLTGFHAVDFFCYIILMVNPCVHLFTKLPSLFFSLLYDFTFLARGNEDPLFCIRGLTFKQAKSTLNQNVADDHRIFCFVLFFYFFLPFLYRQSMLEKITVSRAEAKPVVKFRVSRILSLSP